LAQHDYDVANASGASVRSDLNSVLSAIVSMNSGASAPSTTFAYMWWVDTTNNLVKRRNAANSGWIPVAPVSATMVQAKSTSYTVALSDYGTLLNCTSTFTLSLTAAATLGDGFVFGVKNSGTGIITVDPNSTETVDGSTTIKLYPGEGAIFWCNGTAFLTQGRGTGWSLLNTQSASSSATIDFTTGLDDTFDRFKVVMTSVKPATDDRDLAVRIGTGAGPTYMGTGYQWASRAQSPTAGGDLGSTNITDRIPITSIAGGSGALGTATGENLSGYIEFDNPDGTDFCNIRWDVGYVAADGAVRSVRGNGCWAAGAVTAVRFLLGNGTAGATGTLASGSFRLYGLRK
jgi:hypothetical protein